MPEIQCEAVLFDMDGTIVDSSIPVKRQWRLWAESVGVPFEKVEAVMHGRRAIETMQLVAPHLPQPKTADDFLLVEAQDTEGIVEVPGARALLRALPADRWAVVTSATYDMARSRMRAASLPDVDVLISADRVTHGKPHPEGFLAAAAALRMSPEKCLVVEDSIAGIQAGIAAGMQVLGVTSHYTREQLGTELSVRDFAGTFRMIQEQNAITLRF
jgi:sugar-phosphatase